MTDQDWGASVGSFEEDFAKTQWEPKKPDGFEASIQLIIFQAMLGLWDF